MTHRYEKRGKKFLLVTLIASTSALGVVTGNQLYEAKESHEEVARGKAATPSITCTWDDSNKADPEMKVAYTIGGALPEQGKVLLLCPTPKEVPHTWLLEGEPAPIAATKERLPDLKDIYVHQKAGRVGNNLTLTLTAGELTKREPNSYYRNVAVNTYSLSYRKSHQDKIQADLKKQLEGAVPTSSGPPPMPKTLPPRAENRVRKES